MTSKLDSFKGKGKITEGNEELVRNTTPIIKMETDLNVTQSGFGTTRRE